MARIKSAGFNWQFYWSSWGFFYDHQDDGDFNDVYFNVLIIGPFQAHWWSIDK